MVTAHTAAEARKHDEARTSGARIQRRWGAAFALAAFGTACTAQPAPARTLDQRISAMPDEAYGTVALFAADSLLTCAIVKDGGREANPLAAAVTGKRPSCGETLAFGAVKSLLFLAGISALQDVDARSARRAARITLGIQAGVVGYNASVKLGVRF